MPSLHGQCLLSEIHVYFCHFFLSMKFEMEEWRTLQQEGLLPIKRTISYYQINNLLRTSIKQHPLRSFGSIITDSPVNPSLWCLRPFTTMGSNLVDNRSKTHHQRYVQSWRHLYHIHLVLSRDVPCRQLPACSGYSSSSLLRAILDVVLLGL